jgi:hypothetical protein
VTAESGIARDLYSARRSEALILDLRDVNGGELQAAKEIVDALTGGTVLAGFLEPRNGNRMTLEKLNPNSLWDKPVVVLVNSGTKSSAEVLAGALQDYGAIVVGRRTFGKGTNQISIDLRDYEIAGKLAITQSFIVRPSGKLIQFAGITPDVTLPSPSSKKEKFEHMYPGSITPPGINEVPLGDYDRNDVPFRGLSFRMRLQGLEQFLVGSINRYELGSTMEEQYIEAARRVAKLLIEARTKRAQLDLPFGVKVS